MLNDPLERRAIESFVEAELSTHDQPLVVERWPDCEQRTETDVDAIAGRYAIEHTTVDSFPGQRRDTSRFEVLSHLERTTTLPYRLCIAVPVGALADGADWAGIARRLERWITTESSALSVGAHRLQPDGIPFTFAAWKYEQPSAPGLILLREDPGDDGFVQALASLVTRKANKLARYHRLGSTTLLLLESRCGALMSAAKMKDALRDAFPDGLPSAVNQTWYADWSCASVPTHLRLA